MTDVVLLVGPTASGKSAVALALARHLPTEIISADSMQVYRDVPLLTQQPPAEWQREVPHHLIGTRSLEEVWSAADFRAAALALIEDIRRRGRLALIVGGTGLYVRALMDGLSTAPPAQPAVRAQLLEEITAQGSPAVHARLAAVDPAAAGKIHPNDVRRIIRALEVYEVTRTPISQTWREQSRDTFPYQAVWVGLSHERAVLYDRINARVRRMFDDGVVEEVRALRGRALSHTAGQMLGLSLIREHLAGVRSLEDTITVVQQQTRQYAKRQMVWFRREPRLRWLAADGRQSEAVAAQIQELCRHT